MSTSAGAGKVRKLLLSVTVIQKILWCEHAVFASLSKLNKFYQSFLRYCHLYYLWRSRRTEGLSILVVGIEEGKSFHWRILNVATWRVQSLSSPAIRTHENLKTLPASDQKQCIISPRAPVRAKNGEAKLNWTVSTVQPGGGGWRLQVLACRQMVPAFACLRSPGNASSNLLLPSDGFWHECIGWCWIALRRLDLSTDGSILDWSKFSVVHQDFQKNPVISRSRSSFLCCIQKDGLTLMWSSLGASNLSKGVSTFNGQWPGENEIPQNVSYTERHFGLIRKSSGWVSAFGPCKGGGGGIPVWVGAYERGSLVGPYGQVKLAAPPSQSPSHLAQHRSVSLQGFSPWGPR